MEREGGTCPLNESAPELHYYAVPSSLDGPAFQCGAVPVSFRMS